MLRTADASWSHVVSPAAVPAFLLDQLGLGVSPFSLCFSVSHNKN